MQGKLAVVTGGTKGIGRAVVGGLLELGAQYVAVLQAIFPAFKCSLFMVEIGFDFSN